MRVVDLIDVRGAQRAFAGERLVDVLIERGVVAGACADLERAFGIGQARFGIVVAVASGAGALGAPVAGVLADRTNRVRILAVALSANANVRSCSLPLTAISDALHGSNDPHPVPIPQCTVSESREREVNTTYRWGARGWCPQRKLQRLTVV